MVFKKILNPVYKRLLRPILIKLRIKKVKRDSKMPPPSVNKRREELRIAVAFGGGLGSNLISLGWLKAFYKYLDYPIIFDLYGHEGNLEFASGGIHYIGDIYSRSLFKDAKGYALKLAISYFIVPSNYHMPDLRKICPRLVTAIERLKAFNTLHEKYINNQPKFDGGWITYCMKRNWDRFTMLENNGVTTFTQDDLGALNLEPSAFEILDRYNLRSWKYITIHYGANNNYTVERHGGTAESSVKLWPKAHWEKLCVLLKQKFPNVKIIQLGSGLATPVPGVDINLVGKTDYMKCAVVLKYSLLHIDNESGLVTIRRMVGGKSLVLFGPTPEPFFGYHDNINIVSEFCTNCLWLSNEPWFCRCMRGFPQAECMAKILPEQVATIAQPHITKAQIREEDTHFFTAELNLYASKDLVRGRPIMLDIFTKCNLDPVSHSRHTTGPCQAYLLSRHHWEFPIVLKKITPVEKRLNIIDIGGSRSILSLYLAKLGHNVVVYDTGYGYFSSPSDKSIERRYIAFAGEKGIKAELGSVYNIQAPSDSFDLVTCLSTLHEFTNRKAAIDEMLRILKPKGKLIISASLTANCPSAGTLSLEEFYELVRGIDPKTPSSPPDDVFPAIVNAILQDRIIIQNNAIIASVIINKN